MTYAPVKIKPSGNWICGKCGIGNYSHEAECSRCNAPKN